MARGRPDGGAPIRFSDSLTSVEVIKAPPRRLTQLLPGIDCQELQHFASNFGIVTERHADGLVAVAGEKHLDGRRQFSFRRDHVAHVCVGIEGQQLEHFKRDCLILRHPEAHVRPPRDDLMPDVERCFVHCGTPVLGNVRAATKTTKFIG